MLEDDLQHLKHGNIDQTSRRKDRSCLVYIIYAKKMVMYFMLHLKPCFPRKLLCSSAVRIAIFMYFFIDYIVINIY